MERDGPEFTDKGTWTDVVACCEQLANALADQVDRDVYDRFDAWRPRQDESGAELREKTAEEAAIKETTIERNSGGMKTELKHASQEVKQGGKDAIHGEAKETVQDVGEAGQSAARGVVPLMIQAFRVFEEVVYTHVMGRTNPNVFESGPFSVFIERSMLHDNQYRCRIIFDEKALADTVDGELPE